MRFEVVQRFASSPEAVAIAYADPDLYAALNQLPKLGQPEVLRCDRDGDVVQLDVRYRFMGQLSGAVLAVVDPAKLTWVERSTHHLTSRRTDIVLDPDHYADRLACTGAASVEPETGGSRRRVSGDLRVKALLVAATVERAIISGLREHLEAEVEVVEAFVGERDG